MFDKIQSAKIVLTQKECYHSIIDLYDIIAAKMQYDPQKVNYDCRKICVTKSVQEQVYAYYKEEHHASIEAIGSAWLAMGPKASLPGEDYQVEVQKGFIVETEVKS